MKLMPPHDSIPEINLTVSEFQTRLFHGGFQREYSAHRVSVDLFREINESSAFSDHLPSRFDKIPYWCLSLRSWQQVYPHKVPGIRPEDIEDQRRAIGCH